MTKVLRLHKGAADTIGNWDTSTKIGTKAIESIQDPIGANDKYEITSIPSPFARMDLMKHAFKIVANSPSLEGKTAYHKLVSDCLDVGQIFFNIEKYRDKIEIIAWDRKNDLADLSESGYEEHAILAKTYKTYLEQDCNEYNFGDMDCIYLLNYIDPSAKGEMNIIGATSPATIFFTSANDLRYVGKKIKFDTDCPFDSDYRPLYKRDFEYIKYWYGLRKSRKDFAKKFPEVDLYLEKCFKSLNEEHRAELRQIDSAFYQENYDDIPVVQTAQQYVTVLGEKLRMKSSATSDISSGFEMVISGSLRNGTIPLALPVDTYTEPTKYVIGKWNKDTEVPSFDARPINERTLPDDGAKYPYVTIGDFLEDTIVKIPYKFNSDAFFDGNDVDTDSNFSFILPLKKTFFDYFTAEDLQRKISYNNRPQNRIEIERLLGDAVKVILRIPIKDGGCIKYEKIYYKDGKADAAANRGVIIEKEFTLGLYPNIKYTNSKVKPYHRVALLDRDSADNADSAYSLSFYDDMNQDVPVTGIVWRNRTADNSRFDTNYIDYVTYALESDYQYISLSNADDNNIHGVIIPKFKSCNGGNRKFRFAIDFGTTNTHIEYSIDGANTSKAFDITRDDMQIQKLHITNDYFINNVFNSDFIPEKIGGESLYGYPMRTVISESNNTNWNKAVLTMAHTNIPYTYEKNVSLRYDVIHTDLKWSTNAEDKQRASKYIESILLLLRTKVLLNNGDLNKTEIVWFYPASMTQNRFNKFKAEWEHTFTELFGAPTSNIIAESESVAPYFYHKSKSGATSTVVSIDIGGGTTDVLVVDKGELKYLTSFRFAANSIFGDGYSYGSDSNGFVNKYKDAIMNQLRTNVCGELSSVLESVLDNGKSSDIIAFFFSLASNKDITKKKVEIDFVKMLADDNRGKYVVILFYAAIIYHIAKLMKAKGVDMPRHITFSGNASKVLNILSPNNTTLGDFTKIIFEEVYAQKYPEDGLDIIRPENSKESTCKGGIISFKSRDYSGIKNMKITLIGTDDKRFADEHMTYNDISDADLKSVVTEIKRYIEFVFNLDKKFSFYDNFDIDRSIMSKVKDLCCKDIKTYLDNGLNNKKTEISQDGADDYLEETLFFYPLVGILNAVVRKIYSL